MDDNTRRKKSSSGDSFSFPSTPNQDSDFEFGSLTTPESPSSDPCITSPADHLFFNGRLLPHPFPICQHHHPAAVSDATPRSAPSRTSSIGSKDSMFSSRSNSTNSRGSSCSSARTSSSDSSERKLFRSKVYSSGRGGYPMTRMVSGSGHQVYGCSQRWQYITPVPAALNRDASRRRRGDQNVTKEVAKKKKKKTTRRVRWRLWFGRRIFRWFVMACKECHAMEPSKANKEKTLDEKNVNT